MKKNKNSLTMKMLFLTLIVSTCGFSLLPCSGVSRTDGWTTRSASPPPPYKSSPVNTYTPPPPCPPPSPTARPGSSPSLGRDLGFTTSAPPYRLNWGIRPPGPGTSLPDNPPPHPPLPPPLPPLPPPPSGGQGHGPLLYVRSMDPLVVEGMAPSSTSGAWTPRWSRAWPPPLRQEHGPPWWSRAWPPPLCQEHGPPW